MHDVRAARRWGSERSVFWRSWARVIRGRLPAIGYEAERRDPPPRPAARARTRASGRGRGGASRGRTQAGRCTPAFGARRGGPVSGARRPRAGR